MEVTAGLKTLLIFLICLHQVDISTGVVPDILEGPVTQVIPVGQAQAQFTCFARASAVFWYINDVLIFGDVPDDVTIYPDVHNISAVTVIRRIGVQAAGRNGTKMECLATGDDSTSFRSDPAYLYTVDVPGSPNPVLSTINATALRVTWEESYSWDGFPILDYTLKIYSAAPSFSNITKVYSPPDPSLSPATLEYVLTTDSVYTECSNVTVEVTARNSVGESIEGVAVSGFQVALGDFQIPPKVAVTFSTDLTPMINVSFKPPMICWFQEASYELRIIDALTGEEVFPIETGSFQGENVPTISKIFISGLEGEKSYEAIVVVQSQLTGTTNASITFDTNFAPITVAPILTILNSTAIQAQWNRSSTFEGNVKISYTLVIRNDSDAFELHEEVFNVSADFNAYPMFYVYNFDSIDSNDICCNISFTILSQSSDGESERPGTTIGGLPIGLSNFTSSLEATVSFVTTNLIPKVEISFMYPSICWYQRGSYTVQIFNGAEQVLSMGPIPYQPSNNPVITETFEDGLERGLIYRALVTAASIGEHVQSEALFNTSIDIPTQPTTPTTPPPIIPSVMTAPIKGADTAVIAGGAVGGIVVLTLALAVCMVPVIIVLLRQRKKRAEKTRRPPLPDIPNPLYETGGPLYEEIPGQQNLMFNSLARQPSTTPCTPCSEYVMIEGRVNGEVNHYETDLDDIKKPLDQECSKSLCTEFPMPVPGEDPYMLMNPAAPVTSKDDQCCQLKPSNGATSHAPIRSSLSLPLVSGMRLNRQESEMGDTPEERYVRHSLLI